MTQQQQRAALDAVWEAHKAGTADWEQVQHVQDKQFAICPAHGLPIKAHWDGPVCIRCAEERHARKAGKDA